MRLTIQIDREINVGLLLEELQPVASEVLVNLDRREITLITDQPQPALMVYANHDASKASGSSEALKARRQAAATLREALGKVDLDVATADELAESVRALCRYMLARMGSEGD